MHTKSWNFFSDIMQFPEEKKNSVEILGIHFSHHGYSFAILILPLCSTNNKFRIYSIRISRVSGFSFDKAVWNIYQTEELYFNKDKDCQDASKTAATKKHPTAVLISIPQNQGISNTTF